MISQDALSNTATHVQTAHSGLPRAMSAHAMQVSTLAITMPMRLMAMAQGGQLVIFEFIFCMESLRPESLWAQFAVAARPKDG